MADRLHRAHIAHLLDLLVLDGHQVRYPPGDERTRQASEITTEAQLRAELKAGTFCFDCSQTVEIVCVVAGLKWPRAMRDGYTGTMLDGLPHYPTPAAAGVGALCVYGTDVFPRGHHVTQTRTSGKNPTQHSHGSDRSSHFISFETERSFQPAGYTFLSIAKL